MAQTARTPEIGAEEIEGTEVIGTGSFGKVIRGKCRGKDVAIKVLHKPITDEPTLASFKTEVAIMSTIFHPNICLFMGACTQPGQFFIVQEYMPGGDVEKLLRNQDNKISLYRRMKMAKDAALGVNWLHCSKPSFIHRDLKSSNLLIDENGKVKVCDFGLAQVKPQGQNLQDDDLAKGTPLWMAPEVMQFREFNEKADVYSFGIVLWEFLTRKEPFSHHTNYSKFRKAVCEKGERPEIPPCEPSLRFLIQRCWHPDPEMRPSFPQINQSLDHIIVDVAVRDKWGRKLWKDKFLTKDEVSWPDFAEALCDMLKIPDDSELSAGDQDRIRLNLRCLKAIVADKPKGQTPARKNESMVNIQNWGKILEWFGPIADPATTPHTHTILDDVRELLEKPWFHGDTDTTQAQERLSGKAGGTFLVRFSSVEGWFTISQISSDRIIQHQRVRHKPSEPYYVDEIAYPSLYDLVEQRNLRLFCEGSRFAHIFQKEQPQIKGYINC